MNVTVQVHTRQIKQFMNPHSAKVFMCITKSWYSYNYSIHRTKEKKREKYLKLIMTKGDTLGKAVLY